MKTLRILLVSVLALGGSSIACSDICAQTAVSLFWKKDGTQVEEIVSDKADQYRQVGHHGPAVENSHMALRIYFNDSGAIDVYSKTGRGMELEKYRWYPDSLAQSLHGAGCDEYMVGKTVGLGGIALWDGDKEVKLTAEAIWTPGKCQEAAFELRFNRGKLYSISGGIQRIPNHNI